ncbi:hypothetical protein GXP70_21405 [Paenibacillus lycopersici]|uniref:Uncharacterized protein n=1 Tax=Paenibacillus lycopersici TaxID=2704462 RepID=A0A6C0G2U2_9BACL|nr:hypothetical protein [Paenibacillus lycopersici]QHT62283.1 hypothetical protein GXP70_21405 [Paenibacillus lycopersici]
MIQKYTTGPLNNLTEKDKTVSGSIVVNSLNQSQHRNARVRIKVYALNGKKKLIHNVKFMVKPHASTYNSLFVGNAKQYEVLFITNQSKVQFASFGISPKDRYVAAHRVINSELTRIV